MMFFPSVQESPPPRGRPTGPHGDFARMSPAPPPPAAPEPARPRPIVPLLPYQQEDFEAADRFRWNCWARQTGKSFTKSLRRVIRGLQRRRNQLFLSAGERQSRELMLKARQHCQALQIACDYVAPPFGPVAFRQLEIRLPGNVRIIGLPANPVTVRGFSGDVFLDEFAMHENDRDIWAAMFPSLLRGDGELDVASTPHGRHNLFYELQFNRRFACSRVTLPQAITQGLDTDADALREAMDDETLYRQEFLCEFLDEATAFLTYDAIAACADPTLYCSDSIAALAADPRELFAGVDIGRHRDLTVIWVLARHEPAAGAGKKTIRGGTGFQPAECHGFHTVAIVELAAAPFRRQSAVLGELLAHRRVRRCCIDAGGLGMQLAEQLQDRFGGHRVEPVTFTAALKSQLAGALRIAVESRTIRIPADERIIRDWHALERTVTSAGHFRLAAPRTADGHADRFWAAALALHAADEAPAPFEQLASRPLRFARAGAW